MLSSETVAEKIFKILKGNGHNVELYTDEGSSTVDPAEARRFYVPDAFTMFNLDETDNKRELKVSISAGTQIEDLKDTLYQIKNLANKSVIEYTLKTYSKKIEPKDFDYQAQKVRDMNKIDEAISAAYGSTKSSYQKLENARLIIKHNKPVNEEQRGSRSRNIQAIYIENADGERYRFPSNNLAGGRAMLRHVQEGGTPYDDWGKYIIEQCQELKKLKEFKRYSEKNGLVNEDTTDILEAINARIASIRECLSKSKGGRSYASMREEYMSTLENVTEEGEEDLTELRDMFTVKRFEETLDDALPYVSKLVAEMQAIRERDDFAKQTIESLLSAIESKSRVNIKKGLDVKNDPENPLTNQTLKGAPIQAQLGAIMEYLATVLGGDETDLSVLLARASDLIDNVQDRAMLSKVAKGITSLMQKLHTKASEEVVREFTKVYEAKIASIFKNYDVNKLFS